MSSPRFATRVATICLQILPLLVVAACQQEALQTPRKKPAEVTLPPKTTLKAVQEVDKLLAKFEWGEAHDAICQGCAPGDVSIRPIGLTKDLKGAQGPGKRRIVALIQNYSDQDVDHLQTDVNNKPYKWTFKANTRYLMFVDTRKSDKKATWGYISLDSTYDPDIKPIGFLVNCLVHKPQSTIDDANFQNCNDPYPPRTASGWIKSAFAATRAAASISNPSWVSCDPDCCTGTVDASAAQ